MKRTFKQLKVDLEKVFIELDKRYYKEIIAKRAIDIIYKRVKSGYGTNRASEIIGGSEKQKLEPLSDSYKQQRKGELSFVTTKDKVTFPIGGKLQEFKNKRGQTEFKVDKKGKLIKQKPKLGPFASPDRSNLTLSGQLLESMTYRIGKDILLEIPNSVREKIYPKEKTITNKKLAEIIQAGSIREINGRSVRTKPRPFFSITSGELRILERELDLIIKKILQSLKL